MDASQYDYHCEYAANWITIKYLWELTVTTQEYNFLQNLIQIVKIRQWQQIN